MLNNNNEIINGEGVKDCVGSNLWKCCSRIRFLVFISNGKHCRYLLPSERNQRSKNLQSEASPQTFDQRGHKNQLQFSILFLH
jgi:hypothetical protein